MPRIAVIEKDKCNPVGCGGYLCIRTCPLNRAGKEAIVVGADGKAEIHEEVVNDACQVCVKICPYGAIHMVNLPSEVGNPLHKYGRDGFRLYSLPYPIFGKVVGVLGVNGIGKSVAIKILAQVESPNFARDKPADMQEIIDHFKGTEAQLFFQKVRDANIKVAYKPQAVDLLPRAAAGKVRDLLLKVDEQGRFEKVVSELELKDFLDNELSQISGGELQRVALAATALKAANLFIFDEPSTYLDIRQRIRMSGFVQSLSTADSGVIAVEHDLIILDYIADLVHVMYGESGAYGVVSLPKATRNAINSYLAGMLREENVRFRAYPIKFKQGLPQSAGKPIRLVGWTELKKALGSFSLSAEPGSFNRHEVVGIVGENGIGKTTFIRMLAGVLKQDSGELDSQVKVSYKAQYISTESEESVASILSNAVDKHEAQIIRPLDLKNLLLRPLSKLSGGELQRVAIAACLAREADLYLLDEPSAYLDVEQRLLVAKVIREFADTFGKTAVVVDHDLLFIDQISDRLMVFTGRPAVNGHAVGPLPVEEGMNSFLAELGITMRRDPESKRPRINKQDSQLDRKQRAEGKLYGG